MLLPSWMAPRRADGAGVIARAANLRLEEMFGYEHGELTGRPVELLVPADLQAAHRGHRAAYARAPGARPMGAGARLVALRKDGTMFPAEISLSPVATATGTFTLTVVRDVTQARKLADLALVAVAAKQARPGQQLLDSVTTSLYSVGLSLQDAADLPHDAASKGIAEALRHLDDTIRQIRDNAFTTPRPENLSRSLKRYRVTRPSLAQLPLNVTQDAGRPTRYQSIRSRALVPDPTHPRRATELGKSGQMNTPEVPNRRGPLNPRRDSPPPLPGWSPKTRTAYTAAWVRRSMPSLANNADT